jgi:hypothetical protein
MKKQISTQVEHPTTRRDPIRGDSTRTGANTLGSDAPGDILGPETTEPSAYSHSDEESVRDNDKDDEDQDQPEQDRKTA